MTPEQRRWADQCPLRQWRAQATHRTQATVALQLGVSVNTLRSWEQGVNQPNEDNWQGLVGLLHDKDLSKRWERWLAKQPVTA